ncbi:MAG: glycosyltransferase family 8 protein [Puniceicoccales bacterium]|jgi:lipopolysaccharide biosynthesis glycosyltransferase|nr:glycosyltransferase family 8 protein [Puniceicoccales bacterium]
MEGGPINIAFVFDDKFFNLFKVTAYSIAKNTKSNLAIYIIDCGISETHRMEIGKFQKQLPCVVDIFCKEPKKFEVFEKCPIPAHFSSAVFYRLAIGKTFPHLTRVVYLDCDVIVDGDIKELWDVDLGNRPFGALNDETNFFLPKDIERRKKQAGIPPEHTYMSSGVLLIDLKKFENMCVFERVLKFVEHCEISLACPEQDAMNICLDENEHLPINPRFNFTPFAPQAKRCFKKFGPPLIIHFSCGKPWIFNKKFINILNRLHLFNYEVGFIKKYWKYSDGVDKHTFSSRDMGPTVLFFYKRVFGKLEYFVAKKIRNKIIRGLRNILGKSEKCVQWEGTQPRLADEVNKKRINMIETIDIAFVFDDKFSDLFRVAAYSIAQNTKANLTIYVIDCGISEINREKVLQLKEKCENILSIKIGMPERVDVLENFPTEERFNSVVFYRLAIPKVFPELSRVIYLDCDIVAVGDISELWNEDLNDCPFGAVEEDGNFSDEKIRADKLAYLKFPEENRYYNSGVLLIDSQKFEESQIFERVIEQVKQTKIFFPCPEQDAMNICLRNDEHLSLHPKYNFIPFASLSKKCFASIGENVVLIEYACVKPWEMNRPTVKLFHYLGLCRYSTFMLLKFWHYADQLGDVSPSNKNPFPTLKFFYKRLFQPIGRFFSKAIANVRKSRTCK